VAVNAGARRGRIARRAQLVALCGLAVVVAYTDRVNISVASVAMKEHFGWTQTAKGFVLSSFFIGYLAFMFASGWLATRFGGRRVLGDPVPQLMAELIDIRAEVKIHGEPPLPGFWA